MNQLADSSEDDEALALGIHRGEKRRESEFVERYRQKILTLLMRLTGDRAKAEDLTHDALVLVIQKLRQGSIENPEKLSSYTYSTARFMFYGSLRRMDSRLELVGDFSDVSSGTPEPEEILMLEQQKAVLIEAMKQLSVPRDREILLRHYLIETTKEQSCESLVLSSAHYDRVLSRAKKRLCKHIPEELVRAEA